MCDHCGSAEATLKCSGCGSAKYCTIGRLYLAKPIAQSVSLASITSSDKQHISLMNRITVVTVAALLFFV